MDSDDYDVVYCPEVDGKRVNCKIYDKLCIERVYENHL